MKRFLMIALCLCFCFACFGCEDETAVRSAHISEITGAMSTEYAIKVVLDQDERVKEKYVDLQLKANKENQFLVINEENGDVFTVCLARKDYWYNLTYLISQTNGINGAENYQKYDDFGSKVFIFTSKSDVELTFRVVAGETKVNEQTKEEILVLSEAISSEVKVDVKTHQDNQ